MSVSASYLVDGEIGLDPFLYTPEMSRRARGIPTWAVLKALGRSGLAEMIDNTVARARQFAELLEDSGFQILNDVVLNQVLVGFEDPAETSRVIAAIQDEGTMYAGPTVWQGKPAMRISVSSWRTTEQDVERSVAAIARCASRQGRMAGSPG